MSNQALLILCMALSVVILITPTLIATIKNSRNTGGEPIISVFNVFITSVFFAIAVLFFPMYFRYVFDGEQIFEKLIKSIFISIPRAFTLFFVDLNFVELIEFMTYLGIYGTTLSSIYLVYQAILFTLAPLLSIGILLSVISEFMDNMRFKLLSRRDIYVLSELNEQSFALAKSIVCTDDGRRKLVVICGVDNEDAEVKKKKEELKKLGILFFKRDITEIKIPKLNKNGVRKFFFIAPIDNEDLNARNALSVLKALGESEIFNNKNSQLYVFASAESNDILINTANTGKIKVRIVNDKKNIVWNNLRQDPLFDYAIDVNGVKEINVLLIGFGQYGEEILKTASWLTQLPGFELNIHVIDIDSDVDEKFSARAPELMKYNGKKLKDEPYYNFIFHKKEDGSGIDVSSTEFIQIISSLKNIGRVYVSMGDDSFNIATAIRVRRIFGRVYEKDKVPKISAIVYSDEKAEAYKVNGMKNMKGEDYGIDLIGNYSERFSLSVVEQLDLDELALKFHTAWNSTPEYIELFDKHSYYRRASLSEALYSKITEKTCEKYNIKPTKEEKASFEHLRWNAYMRSLGYVYGAKRDDISKVHPSLLPTNELSPEEIEKDYRVVEARDEKSTKND